MRLRIPSGGLSRCVIRQRCLLTVGITDYRSTTRSFEQRLNGPWSRKHQASSRRATKEIARLRDELNHLQQRPATTAPTKPQDEIEKTKAGYPEGYRTKKRRADTNACREFNPICGHRRFQRQRLKHNNNPARNRFDLGTLGCELRAAVDPRADGRRRDPVRGATWTIRFSSTKPAQNGDVNSGVEIEEAYLLLMTRCSNLTAKVGRFHLRLGDGISAYHDWPTADNQLRHAIISSATSINRQRPSLSYVVPADLIGGNYVEAIAEIHLRRRRHRAPVLNNMPRRWFCVNTHLIWNHDLARDWISSWRIVADRKHNVDNQQKRHLFGADVSVHIEPHRRILQSAHPGRGDYGVVDTDRTTTNTPGARGCWRKAASNRDWYAGCRLDWTENALNDISKCGRGRHTSRGTGAEFLRFRASIRCGGWPSETPSHLE